MRIGSRLKDFVPFKPQLKPAWLWFNTLPRQIAIRCGGKAPRDVVRVSYGHRHVPKLSEYAQGGMVKFQWMQTLYPNTQYSFNTMYMVSSQPPKGATHLARTAQKTGARLIWNQNGVAYPGWYGPDWQQRNAPMAELLHAADYVFYQSVFCKLAADKYLGESQGAWEILYNPVDTQIFKPAASDPEPNGLVLLLAGTQYQY